MITAMRRLARLLLTLVVVSGLVLPQGGTYCLTRLFGGSEGARKSECDACCRRAVRAERHETLAPTARPVSCDSSGADACCLVLPEIGGAVDASARARLDADHALAQLATPLFFAPDDFAASLAADGRLAFASRGPPDAPRVHAVPIALPLRL